MTEVRKGFRRFASEVSEKSQQAKPASPKSELCGKMLQAMKSNNMAAVDDLMRDGLGKKLIKPEELVDFQAERGSSDQHAWMPLTTRASEMLRYGHPESQLALSAWQIASWLNQAKPDLSSEWLAAARQACLDVLATGLDQRRPLGIKAPHTDDGCKDMVLPEGIFMIRFSREGHTAKQLPGMNLEEIHPNQDNFTYDETARLTFAQRTSPHVLLEATNHSWYDDDHDHPGCDGVAYFSPDPAKLDAFIASRPTLAAREALFEQAARGSMSVLEAVDNGFPVDLSSNWRPGVRRLIHEACSLAHGHLVEGLLDRGASPNRRPDEYIAPIYSLFRFAMRESEEATQRALSAMLQKGLLTTAEDTSEHGEMPLHKAARNDWPVIAGTLLQMGADPMHKNDKGETPIDIARQRVDRDRSSSCAALFDAWMVKNQIDQIAKIRASAVPVP